MVDLLSDFNLLLYLCESLDIHGDMPKICVSIVDRSVPLDDGYKILIKGIAGLEGSYWNNPNKCAPKNSPKKWRINMHS